jgi:hypothetical protein
MRLLIVGGMLALAVSASMTPANAASGFPKFMCNGVDTGIPGPIIAWGSAKPNCGTPPSYGTAPVTIRGVVLLCCRRA